jgi:hypothetical protein
MSGHLLVSLILMTAAPQRGELRRPPAVPPGGVVVRVFSRFEGERKLHYVTVTMPEAKRAVEDDDEVERPRNIVRLNLQTAVLESDNFDRWLFDDDRTAKDHRDHLDGVLERKIQSDTVGRTLTRAQRARLKVAGRGDIKRFFDQVEDERSKFEKERRGWQKGIAALGRLDSLAKVYAEGPFGARSLYSKMLYRIDVESRAGL